MTLLRAGLDANVLAHIVSERGTTIGRDAQVLSIDMYLNRPLVDQIVRAINLLDRAKAAGFDEVRLGDKGRNGVWIFQVSQPKPWCSLGLCY
jgi:hypothetical protein